MGIHSGIGLTAYGRREWCVATVVAAAACGAIVLLARAAGMWWLALMVLPVAVWLEVLWFFRDPDRTAPADENEDERLLISPADGHVADITNVGAGSPLGRPGVKIGIFMNIFDVHVNRSPAAARVVSFQHMKGVFLDARDPEAATRNESATIHLACIRGGKEYPLVVRQVAGLIARRIVTDLTEGQQLARCERIGMIKFGSRVELFVPSELVGRVEVQVPQHVLAGSTVLVSPPESAAPDGGEEKER